MIYLPFEMCGLKIMWHTLFGKRILFCLKQSESGWSDATGILQQYLKLFSHKNFIVVYFPKVLYIEFYV